MKKKLLTLVAMAVLIDTMPANAQQTALPLKYWFDSPVSLRGKAIWYGGKPEAWKNGKKPISAGDTATNPDSDWESQSLPIGNGSLGANILGSVEAERITFNEKTLWRGGPNTAKGCLLYTSPSPRD